MVCSTCKSFEFQLKEKDEELQDVNNKFAAFKLKSKGRLAQLKQSLTDGLTDADAWKADRVSFVTQVSSLEAQLEQRQAEAEELERKMALKEVQILDHAIKIRALEEELRSALDRRSASGIEHQHAADLEGLASRDVERMYAQMVYKDTRIMELNNTILDKERQILDLQETCREQGQLVQAKARACQIVQQRVMELDSRSTTEASTETEPTPVPSRAPAVAVRGAMRQASPGHAVVQFGPGDEGSPPPVDPSEDRSSVTTEVTVMPDDGGFSGGPSTEKETTAPVAEGKKKQRKKVTFDLTPHKLDSQCESEKAVEEMTQAVADLTAENDELRSTIQESEHYADSQLRTRISELEDEVEQVRRDGKNQALRARAAAQGRIRDLEEKISTMQQETTEKIDKLESSVESVSSGREWALSENGRLMEQLAANKDKLNEVREELEDRKADCDKLCAGLRRKGDEAEQLKSSVHESEETVAHLLEQKTSILDDVDRLKEAIEAQSAYIELLESDVVIYEAHIGMLHDSLGASQSDKRKLIKSKAFETKLTALEQEKEQMAKRNNDERLRIKALSAKIKTLEEANSVMAQRLHEMDQASSAAQGSSETPEESRLKEQELAALGEQVLNLEHELNEARDHTQHMECANFELGVALQELKTEMEQADSRLQQAEMCLEHAQMRAEQAESVLETAEDRAESGQMRADLAESRLDELEFETEEARKVAELAELKVVEVEARLESASRDADNAKAASTRAEARVEHAQSMAEREEARADKADSRADAAESKLGEAERKAKEAESKLEEAERKAEEEGIKASEAQLRAIEADFRADDAVLKAEEMKQLLEDAELKKQLAESRIEEAEMMTEEAERMAEQARNMKEAADWSVENAEEEVGEMVNEAITKVEKAEHRLKEVEMELSLSKGQGEEMQARVHEMEQIKNEAERNLSEMSKKLMELQDEKATWMETLMKGENELKSEKEASAMVREELETIKLVNAEMAAVQAVKQQQHVQLTEEVMQAVTVGVEQSTAEAHPVYKEEAEQTNTSLREEIIQNLKHQEGLELDVARVMQLNEDLELGLGALNGQVWTLQKQLKETALEKEQTAEKIQALEQTCLETEARYKEQNEAYNVLTGYYQQLQQGYNELYASTIRNANMDSQQNVNTVQNTGAQATQLDEEQNEESKAELEHLHNELESTKAELSSVSTELAQLRATAGAELTQLRELVTHLRGEEIAKLKDLISKDVSIMAKELRAFCAQVLETLQRAGQVQDEEKIERVELIKRMLEQLANEDSRDASDSEVCLAEAVEMVKGNVACMRKMLDETKKALQEQRTTSVALEDRLVQAENELERKEELEALPNLLEATQIELTRRIDECSRLHARVQQLESENREALEELKREATRLTTKQADNDALFRCNAEMVHTNVRLQNEVDSLKEELGQAKHAAVLESQNEEAGVEVNAKAGVKVEHEADNTNTANSPVKSEDFSEASSEGYIYMHISPASTHTSSSEDDQRTIKQLKEEIATLKLELDRVPQIEARKVALKEKVKKAYQLASRQEKELEKLKAELKNMECLEKDNRALKDQVKSLTWQCQSVSEALEGCQTEKEKLDVELSVMKSQLVAEKKRVNRPGSNGGRKATRVVQLTDSNRNEFPIVEPYDKLVYHYEPVNNNDQASTGVQEEVTTPQQEVRESWSGGSETHSMHSVSDEKVRRRRRAGPEADK